MLNQYSYKPLKAAEQSPVYHNNTVLCIVSADISRVKPLRQLEVKLYRGKLPAPSQSVFDMEVDFGPVESAFPCLDFIFYVLALKRFLKRFLCCVPVFNFSHEFFRPCAELNLVLKIKNLFINKICKIKHTNYFFFNHFRSDKNMRIILRHFSHSCQSCQSS